MNREIAFGREILTATLRPGASLTVACRPADFCASALARAIEDSDAHLVSLNLSNRLLDDGRLVVELRTNRANVAATGHSLERYGFEVIAATDRNDPGEPGADNDTLRSRAAELLHIMNL